MKIDVGKRRFELGIVLAGLIISLSCIDRVLAQNRVPHGSYSVVAPPACANNKGEVVQFVDAAKGRAGMAAGMARRNEDGKPVVLRSNFASAPPVFQGFIDRHECAHHQTGDVDLPHPPRNGPEHLMNESISDCIAILRLRDEEGYDQSGLKRVLDALRGEMEKIGFPEISITSRSSNIANCFGRPGTAQEFVDKILERRGLLR